MDICASSFAWTISQQGWVTVPWDQQDPEDSKYKLSESFLQSMRVTEKIE